MALKEEDLPDYDKDALSRERALRKTAEECRQEQEKAKAELPGLKKERQKLDRKAERYAEEARRLDQEIKEKQGKVKKSCATGNVSCVPSDETKLGILSQDIGTAINKNLGTRIDIRRVAQWEGGVYLKAYIPWWPVFETDGTPKMSKIDKNTRLQGMFKGNTPNNSGVTIAKGVDFGGQNKTVYFKELEKYNNETKLLTEEELGAFTKKIDPYFNKKGGEACAFLRKFPLEITQKEADLLNLRAADNAAKAALKDFNSLQSHSTFKDLTTEQQTALFSQTYQRGRAQSALQNAIIENDREKIPSTREREYLYMSMPHKGREK